MRGATQKANGAACTFPAPNSGISLLVSGLRKALQRLWGSFLKPRFSF
jgi:hypothetical protein